MMPRPAVASWASVIPVGVCMPDGPPRVGEAIRHIKPVGEPALPEHVKLRATPREVADAAGQRFGAPDNEEARSRLVGRGLVPSDHDRLDIDLTVTVAPQVLFGAR